MSGLGESYSARETPPKKPPRPNASSANLNDTINSYRLPKSDATWRRQEEIGHGKYGSVWVETCTRNGKTEIRAVKEVLKTGNQEVDAELLALVKLSAPELKDTFGRFEGWYETKDSLCFVLEYFEHGDLRRYLGKEAFSEVEALEIIRQLLLAVQVMHAEGFVHRDLKLENIFVLQPRPLWSVKIGDFGVSRPLEKSGSTAFTNGVGTAEYMAPEAIPLFEDEDENEANLHAIDIWSIGIILFELLHCRRPFTGKNCLLQLRTYCESKPWQVSGTIVCSGIGEGTETLIRKMLRPYPKDRPNATTLHSEVCKQLFELRSGSGERQLSGVTAYDPTSNPNFLSTQSRINSHAFEASSVRALRNQFEKDYGQSGQRENNEDKRLGLLLPTLRKAVMNNDIDEIVRLAQPGPAISGVDQEKKTLLHLAVQQQNVKLVELLLQLKAPLEATDIDGHTALHLAAMTGEAQIAQKLIDFGSAIDAPSKSGRTALYQAVACQHLNLVQILLHNAAQPAVADFQSVTALHEASKMGYMEAVKLLLEWEADVNARSASGRTPLFEAVAAGKEVVVQHLLDSGADIHLRYRHGDTVLHEAAKQGRVLIVQLLMANGANPNATSVSNTESFSIVVGNSSAQVYSTVRFLTLVLLKINNDPAARAKAREERRRQAAYERSMRVRERLYHPKPVAEEEEEEEVVIDGQVRYVAKGTFDDGKKPSSQPQPARFFRTEPVMKLRNRLGRTPLHEAKARNHTEVVKILAPATTPITIEDKFQNFLDEQQFGQKILNIIPDQQKIMGLLPDQERIKGLFPNERTMKGLIPDQRKMKVFFTEPLKIKDIRPDWLVNRTKSSPDPHLFDGALIEMEDNEELDPETLDRATALTQLEPIPMLPPRPGADRSRAISAPVIPLHDQTNSRKPKPPVPVKKFKDPPISTVTPPPSRSMEMEAVPSSVSPSADGSIRISVAKLPTREAMFGHVAGAVSSESKRRESLGSSMGVSAWRLGSR